MTVLAEPLQELKSNCILINCNKTPILISTDSTSEPNPAAVKLVRVSKQQSQVAILIYKLLNTEPL